MLTRRQFGLLGASQVSAGRPNVVVSLDGPAGGGLVFSRAYAVSADPGPSRGALETGRYPHANGWIGEGTEIAPEWKRMGDLYAAHGYRRYPEEPYFSWGLPAGPVRANTIVVTTRLAQGDWHESSVRVPLTMAWPECWTAGKVDWLMASVDILPTLLTLCGLPVPDQVQGTDRSSLLLGRGGEQPASLYVQGRLGEPDEWRMIIRGWDKLIVNRELQPTHLYNLALDPGESENQVEDRGTIRRREELLALMRPWIVKIADRIPYPVRKRR